MPAITFTVTAADGKARAGVISTAHGDVPTPVFMPVATQGTVKCLTSDEVRATGARMMLSNAYHLMLRPGAEVIRAAGGLQKWTGWRGPMLTDSGGYQLLSLAQLAQVSDEGVKFRSHVDGSALFVSPEEAVRVQSSLGADIIMPLDDCVGFPAGRYRASESVRRTTLWAKRSVEVHKPDSQALFGIIQGSTFPDLRRRSAEEIVALGLPGHAIGGVSVGEGAQLIREVAGRTVEFLPADRPRYLMGVGLPEDVLDAVAVGVDMFDCIVPTRNGRNGWAFTFSGVVRVRNSAYIRDGEPIEAGCDCHACRNFSRSYIRHLFNTGEITGMALVSLHNLRFYARLLEGAREAIEAGRYEAYRTSIAGSSG